MQPVEETDWGTRRLYSVGEGITDAIISVDPDAKVAADVRAKMVDVDSWLFAEEFLVAFYDAGYDVQIAQR
ncbi:copper chaperone [Paraburkholderia azotifigens]|uniref:Copper chaperone n=1 Tax=Paraburkholderia azotifigens TaxID=2057004 RepID=A0ABU9R094_9BURK